MNRLTKILALAACALGTSFLMTACGGGAAEAPPSAINAPTTAPPPDTVPPTLAIFNDVSGAKATGPVTFSFVFSEDVGVSFTTSDVAVTGGTAGALTKVSAKQYTMVVTPPTNASGTLVVTVGVGKFSDIAGNVNAAAPTAAQVLFETVVKSQMALPVNFDSGTVDYGLVGFGGAEDSSIAADPVNAPNKVAKVVRAAGSETYAGTTITAGSTPATQLGFSPKVPFNANDTKMSVRVWSPDAGIPVRLKVEDHADPTHSVETEATVTTAAGWQTLTFNFAPGSQAAGTSAINFAYNYDKATIFFDFGRAKASAVQKTYYFDDLAFVAGTGVNCGTTAPTCAPATVIPSGSVTIYSDAAQVAGFNPHPDWGQAPPVTYSEVTIAANKSLKYGFSAGALYEGLDWAANPVNVSAKGKLHLDFWSADITSVKVSIISANKENAVTQALTVGSWNSVDIDLSSYTVPDKTAIIQIKIEPIAAGTLYVDNVYFWGAAGGQSCGTTAPTCAPATVIPSGSVTIYSDAAQVAGFNPHPDWGQAPPVTYSEVTIAANKSLKYGFSAGALYEGLDWAANPVNVSAKGKLHLDFWSADITSVKVSIISANKENAVTQALTVGSWNSVDIDLSSYTVPDKTAIIQIKLEPIVAGTLYVDNVYFWGSGTGGGFAGTYAENYTGTGDLVGARTAQGGDVGFFFDPRLFSTKSYDYGGVANSVTAPGSVYNFYYGLGLNAPAITDAYFGAYVKAPGNASVNVAAFASLKLNVWGPDQLFKAGAFPALTVVMQGPAVAGCSSNSGGSEVKTTFNTTTQGAASIYTLPLSAFTLTVGCGGDTTVAQVLAHIAQINVLLQGTNIQYLNKDPNGVAFTNGLNIGTIKFN